MQRALSCHPASPASIALNVGVTVRREARALRLRYAITGDVDAILLPARANHERKDDLWRRTCFEAFLIAERGAPYVEYNFSPSTQWAAYAFTAYRARAPDWALRDRPAIETHMSDGLIALDARIDLDDVAERLIAPPALLGATAVIEEKNGVISYWALTHPRAKPEFHDCAGFTLALNALAP